MSQTSSRRDSCLTSRCSQCHKPASSALITASLIPAAAAADDDDDVVVVSIASTKTFGNRAESFKHTHTLVAQPYWYNIQPIFNHYGNWTYIGQDITIVF